MATPSIMNHLASLPGYNAALLVATLVVGVVILWATAGAALTSLEKYPPRGGRSRAEVVRRRRAWATVFFLAATVLWSAYRVDVLWTLETPVSHRALGVEVVRAVSAVLISWAWRPGVGQD